MIEQGADREVLDAAIGWLRQGERVVLVTVCRTFGSSPRPPGSLLAIAGDGRAVGSVSGGCVEDDLIARHRAGYLAGEPISRVCYGVDSEDAARFGLPCGGRLELIVESLQHAEALTALTDGLDRGRLVARETDLESGQSRLEHIPEPLAMPCEFAVDATRMRKVFGPAWHLLLVGDGQIARYLARMASMLDYRVTLCDPREGAFLEPLPGNIRTLAAMPDEAVASHADNPRSAVITLAHDPKVDDMALMVALESSAFYVGALGSARTSEARRQRLGELGVAPAALARLDAPVGMPIGSRTPAEIAVSILAGLIARRRT